MHSFLAAQINKIKPSPTISISTRAKELQAQGKDVISLSSGEPDFDTPQYIKEAAIKAINDGQTKYTAVTGTSKLKNAICYKFKRENNLNYEPSQILTANGAKQCIFNLMLAILNPGDEVIIPAPYWVSYPDMVTLCNAKPIIATCSQEEQFKLQVKKLTQLISSKTKLLLLNSPSNPTGSIYNKQELLAFADVLRQYPNICIATDDIYEHIRWNNQEFINLLNVAPDLKDRIIVINGVSKAFAMTGWRIGYAAGNPIIIKAMSKIQEQSTSNPCSISQAAAIAALEGNLDCIQPMIQAFKERHDFVFNALNDIDGVTCLPVKGAFYAFPSFEQIIDNHQSIENDIKLSEMLITSAKVAIVPGSAFGAPKHIRLSYATSMPQLEKAMLRIKNFVKQL